MGLLDLMELASRGSPHPGLLGSIYVTGWLRLRQRGSPRNVHGGHLALYLARHMLSMTGGSRVLPPGERGATWSQSVGGG